MPVLRDITSMQISGRPIGLDHPPYVIAEIGVNHDGEVERALELTDAAADAGADAVKLQYFETDRLMSKAAKLAAYQKAAGETDPIAMLRRLELSLDEMARVVERAHERGIHAIVTMFSTELVDQAEMLPWDAYKSASPDIINKPLLERYAETDRPLIASTGASTMEEVVRAVGWMEPARDRLVLLHCVSSYPAPDAALEGIALIQEATRIPTGYSDHTDTIETGARATRAGAVMLERHVTYDTQADGPDHAASLDPTGFARYASSAREAPRLRGRSTGEKLVLDCEQDVRTVSRQSLVPVRDLAPGERITASDLTTKRPGTGILACDIDEVIGRPVARPVKADVPLMPDDLT